MQNRQRPGLGFPIRLGLLSASVFRDFARSSGGRTQCHRFLSVSCALPRRRAARADGEGGHRSYGVQGVAWAALVASTI